MVFYRWVVIINFISNQRAIWILEHCSTISAWLTRYSSLVELSWTKYYYDNGNLSKSILKVSAQLVLIYFILSFFLLSLYRMTEWLLSMDNRELWWIQRHHLLRSLGQFQNTTAEKLSNRYALTFSWLYSSKTLSKPAAAVNREKHRVA